MSKSDSETPRSVNFRSAVLIAVLVVIPMGVIFRDALPESLKTFGSKVKKAVQIVFLSSEEESPNYRSSGSGLDISDDDRSRLEDEDIAYSEPPLFNPERFSEEFSMNRERAPAANRNSMPRYAPRDLPLPEPPRETGESFRESLYDSPIRQAGYEQDKSIPANDSGLFRPQSAVTSAHGYDSDSMIIPAGHVMGSDLDAAELILPESNDLQEIRKPKSRYGDLEAELKELGASYYRLETWGDRGEYFKFSCYVQNPNEPGNLLKHFQAVEGEDIEAMKKVIREIRTWKIMEW